MISSLPLLYSFRRCPYAMRARLGIAFAGIIVELREIVLRNKPAHMLEISPKGTVPVLQLPGGRVVRTPPISSHNEKISTVARRGRATSVP